MPGPLKVEWAEKVLADRNITALEPYQGTNHQWRVRCNECGEEFRRRAAGIEEHGCPGCRRIAATNSIEEEMRAAGLEPLEPYPGSTKAWRCQCSRCQQEVSVSLKGVRKRKGKNPDATGCRACINREQMITPEDVARAEMREAGLEPIGPFPNSNAPWPSTCTRCGGPCRPRLTSLRAAKKEGRPYFGCRACGRRHVADLQRMSEAEAVAEANAAGADPIEPFVSVNAPWPMRCRQCGDVSSPTLSNIRGGHAACRSCALRRVHDKLRFDPEEADRICRDAGLIPIGSFPGTVMLPWDMTCDTCGHTFTTRLNRIQNGHGCPGCATTFFNMDEPAFVYLVINDDLEAQKIGVTGTDKGRMDEHARFGWQALGLWELPAGRQAIEIERAVLRWWRKDLGIPPGCTSDQMPQGGETETASLSRLSPTETLAFVEAWLSDTGEEIATAGPAGP